MKSALKRLEPAYSYFLKARLRSSRGEARHERSADGSECPAESMERRNRPTERRESGSTSTQPSSTHAQALEALRGSSREGHAPWPCRAGTARGHIALRLRGRRGVRLRLCPCVGLRRSSQLSGAQATRVRESRNLLVRRLSASAGAPRLSDGSRVNTSVATSVCPSWLLRNASTRCRVALPTAATASLL